MGQSASKKQNARHSQRVSRTSVWFGVAGAAMAACRAISFGILVLLATASVQPCMAATTGDDQRPVAAAFGSGVHAYYASDYARSYDDLTGAIEAGSLDPRTFYFRGLAALKLGRSDEAAADFEDGANREADGGGSVLISRTLERVQGNDRLQLERFRARARVATLSRNRESIRRRYSEIYDAESDVLRQRRPESTPNGAEPLAKPAPKSRVPSAPNAEKETEEPEDTPVDAEATDEAMEEENPAEEPLAEEAPAEDPVAAEAPESPASETDDPFGDDPVDSKNDQKDGQMEETAAEVDNTADQRDAQQEAEAAEVDSTADQRDAQKEAEADAGEMQEVEEVKDDTTSINLPTDAALTG